MSTPGTKQPAPCHAPEEATRWFNQWHAYRAIVDANWMALTPEGLASTIEHVTQRDFPETIEALSFMARKAGFPEPQELLRDATGFHRLLAFVRASASG